MAQWLSTRSHARLCYVCCDCVATLTLRGYCLLIGNTQALVEVRTAYTSMGIGEV